jgi:protein-S-isoprenylcysteine O-methyltransferase Ste14
MYTGALLLFLATPVALGSTWAFAAALPLCGAVVARMLDEERVLLRDLPAYTAYCARVRFRLIPRVW